MTNPSDAFFDQLAQRGHIPLLENEHGRLRVELADEAGTRNWTVTFDHGDVTVSHEDIDVDGVIRADRALFDRAAQGEENLMTARLRGDLSLDGSLDLIVQFSRLLPGPPSRQEMPGRQEFETTDRAGGRPG
jgi:hypothetical protein